MSLVLRPCHQLARITSRRRGLLPSSTPPRHLSTTTTEGPLPLYHRLVSEGKLMPDENQLVVVQQLQELYGTLSKYDEPSAALQVSPYLLRHQTTNKRWIYGEMLNLLVPKGE